MINSSGIYQILNTENGKKYVGSAKRFYVRRQKHLSALNLGKHHAKHLQSAFNKYGEDSFEFEILLVCAPEDLIFFEQRALDSIHPEYNTCKMAGNTLGVKCTAATKRKISKAHTGVKLSAEHRKKIADAGIGRKPSEEAVKNMVIAAKLKAADPEWRRKVSVGRTGIRVSEEHKEKLRKAKTGVPTNLTEESRLRKNKKISESNRTRVITDQHRKNASNSHRVRANIERFLYGGEERTVLSLAEEFGLCRHTLRKRINAGWDMERALNAPVAGNRGKR